MQNIISSLLRQATRRTNEYFNIITFCTHERYETNLAASGHNFYAVRAPGIKDWNMNYATLPVNYNLLRPYPSQQINIQDMVHNYLPPEVDFDLVLSQNKFGQFQIAKQLSQYLHLPLISLEHTLPVPSWPQAQLDYLKNCKGDLNLFISEFSREAWGWGTDEANVIHHGIDTDTFKCNNNCDRTKIILSVCNDWINRDWCCGYKLWQEVVQGLPTRVVGDTKGLSLPAKSVADLVNEYGHAQIFLNTSLISPVPTSLLEAMACSCACVSTATCMIPTIIENGVNGFISNNPNELRSYCLQLLNDRELCSRLGRKARQTILDKFSDKVFIENWNKYLQQAANITYKGETL